MRLFIAILAWAVLVFSLIFTLYSTVGTFAALRSHAVSDAAIVAVLLNSVSGALMRLLEAVALFAGLLFLLDVDKRLRLRAGEEFS